MTLCVICLYWVLLCFNFFSGRTLQSLLMANKHTYQTKLSGNLCKSGKIDHCKHIILLIIFTRRSLFWKGTLKNMSKISTLQFESYNKLMYITKKLQCWPFESLRLWKSYLKNDVYSLLKKIQWVLEQDFQMRYYASLQL